MTIFISVASYRDPLLRFTLLEAYDNAKNKQHLVFGVVEQEIKDRALDLDSLPFKEQIRYVRIEPEQSRGCCWARSLVQSLYRDELYYFQIDSHTAFDKDWDVTLVKHLEDLRIYHPKPVISGYPHALRFDENNNPIKEHPTQSAHPFIVPTQPNGVVFGGGTGRHIRGGESLVPATTDVVHAFMLAAGGLFTLGKVVEEVPYDPYILFEGEEPSLALRLWTHGWNIFQIRLLPFFHLYTEHEKTPRTLFWNQGEDDKRNFTWSDISSRSIERLNKILVGEMLGVYGLGCKRSFEDFRRWSGVDYINRVYEPTDIWKVDMTISPEEHLSRACSGLTKS
jgi:hypothetical protein